MNIKKFVKNHKRQIIVGGLVLGGAVATGFICYKMHTAMAKPKIPNMNGDAILRVGVESVDNAMPTSVALELSKNGKRGFAIDISPETAIEVGEELIETGKAVKAGTILDRMHL